MNENQIATVDRLNREWKKQKTQLFQKARSKQIPLGNLLSELQTAASSAEEILHNLLDEQQQTRLEELFVQINDASALTDRHVLQRLNVKGKQLIRLATVRKENTQALRGAFATFQNLPRDKQLAKFESLQESSRTRLLSVLTKDQLAAFEKMKGEPIDFSYAEFRIPLKKTRDVSAPNGDKDVR